jgi:hypothetical protein
MKLHVLMQIASAVHYLHHLEPVIVHLDVRKKQKRRDDSLVLIDFESKYKLFFWFNQSFFLVSDQASEHFDGPAGREGLDCQTVGLWTQRQKEQRGQNS